MIKNHELLPLPQSLQSKQGKYAFFQYPDPNIAIFGYSGYGFIANQDYLSSHQLPAPTSWEMLTDPMYAGHVAIGSPSRSITTHFMVESILQHYGWDKGWALLYQIAGNTKQIAARSYGVSDMVSQGTAGVGPVLDSFAFEYQKQFPFIEFHYQKNTPRLPSFIAGIKHSTPNKYTLKNEINQHLESITAAIKKTISLQNHVTLKQEHELLTQDIAVYINLLAQRNDVLTNLKQTQNAIKWLHQDLIDELSPLRQDVEWQLKRMMPAVQQDRALAEVMTEFSLIQAITIKENELHQLIEDIILQRRQRDLGNAFYFIDYKIKEITRLSLQLAHYQTTTNYRQLLKEFITPIYLPLKWLLNEKIIQNYSQR
ncbi:hypothetical protein DA099_09175 [Photobacterium damselae]|nr:hypothetical protein DA099_09175 [Photobacterium damselae]